MLFVHNLSWNTAELSIIPWSFPSYQGSLECVSQTLNHPFRAAFQRGCSWTSDVSILCITLSFISLSCCVMCSVHKDVSSLDSWPYSSSQPGVICSRQHLAILETFLLVETRDALQHPTAHRTGPPAKFRMSVGPRLRNPGLQNQQLKSLFVLISWSWNSMPWPSGWVIYLHSTPSPQGHMWVEEEMSVQNVLLPLGTKHSLKKHIGQLSTYWPSGFFWGTRSCWRSQPCFSREIHCPVSLKIDTSPDACDLLFKWQKHPKLYILELQLFFKRN